MGFASNGDLLSDVRKAFCQTAYDAFLFPLFFLKIFSVLPVAYPPCWTLDCHWPSEIATVRMYCIDNSFLACHHNVCSNKRGFLDCNKASFFLATLHIRLPWNINIVLNIIIYTYIWTMDIIVIYFGCSGPYSGPSINPGLRRNKREPRVTLKSLSLFFLASW